MLSNTPGIRLIEDYVDLAHSRCSAFDNVQSTLRAIEAKLRRGPKAIFAIHHRVLRWARKTAI